MCRVNYIRLWTVCTYSTGTTLISFYFVCAFHFILFTHDLMVVVHVYHLVSCHTGIRRVCVSIMNPKKIAHCDCNERIDTPRHMPPRVVIRKRGVDDVCARYSSRRTLAAKRMRFVWTLRFHARKDVGRRSYFNELKVLNFKIFSLCCQLNEIVSFIHRRISSTFWCVVFFLLLCFVV